MEELVGARSGVAGGAGDGGEDGDGARVGNGGANLLLSCVRGAGPSGGRTPDGAMRDSVRSLLTTLSEVARPSEQPA
jgi:hypothetical protein